MSYFYCTASRAIHLESARTLGKDSFINSLQRFLVCRRPVRQLVPTKEPIGSKQELGDEIPKFQTFFTK